MNSLHEYLFWAYENNSGFEGAVRRDSWKLIINRRGGSGIELFNLSNDPIESNNLVVKYPDVVEELKDAFISWMDEMAARNGEGTPNWRLEEMFALAQQNYNIIYEAGEAAPSPPEATSIPNGRNGAASTSHNLRIQNNGMDAIAVALLFSLVLLF